METLNVSICKCALSEPCELHPAYAKKTELPTAVAWRDLEVKSCDGCPFEFSGFQCRHPDACRDFSLEVHDRTPPAWCPLRHVSTLVRLHPETRS